MSKLNEVNDENVERCPLISVIIVNWNTRELLAQVLKSLFEQTPQSIFEVVVVDNGSTDGSGEMVRTIWHNVKLLCLPRNVGFAAGNNAGFEQAVGQYFLLLNTDTIVLPTTVSGLASLLRLNADTGCVGARHLNLDGSLQRSTNEFPTLFNDLLELTEISRLKIIQEVLQRRFPWWGDHSYTCDTGWVNGACMMVRRSVIEEVGGLDESFFAYVEEVDWCYRMRQRGWRVVFTPTAEVIHLSGQSLNADPARRLRLRYWGHASFYRKHYSKATFRVFQAIVVVVSIGRIVALSLLKMLNVFGYVPSKNVWELVTQESSRARYGTMLFAWWKILCHSNINDASKLGSWTK